MKSNFVKYIFIIFVVIIIVFVIYKLTNNKTDESEGQATIEQTESENEIIKEKQQWNNLNCTCSNRCSINYTSSH